MPTTIGESWEQFSRGLPESEHFLYRRVFYMGAMAASNALLVDRTESDPKARIDRTIQEIRDAALSMMIARSPQRQRRCDRCGFEYDDACECCPNCMGEALGIGLSKAHTRSK
jgi:hypothetical protein